MAEYKVVDTLFPLLLKEWEQSWVAATNSPGELKCRVEAAWGGGYTTAEDMIAAMLAGLPQDSLFQGIGVGPAQYSVITMAIITGGNVRVGFEDNIFYKRGELLKSNAQAVEKAARIATELDRAVATPAQAREMLGLSQTPTSY